MTPLAVEASIQARKQEQKVAGQAKHLALLTLCRAAAQARGEEEGAALCRDAERRFLEDHLEPTLSSFARHVEEREPGGALAAVARMAEGTAKVHAEAVGARLEGPPAPAAGGDARRGPDSGAMESEELVA